MRILRFAGVGISLMALSALAQESTEKLQTLKNQFEELKADAFSAQEKFDERYLGELKKLEEKAQGVAKLELVLAVRKEVAVFRTRDAVKTKPSPHAELARFQQIYDDQKTRNEEERETKLATLVTGYRKQLTDLQVGLTKAGDIDGAIGVQAELRKLEADVAATPKDGGEKSAVETMQSLITSRKWFRESKVNKGVFIFHPDGTATCEDFETSWNRWEIKGDTFFLTIPEGKIEFTLSENAPYTLQRSSSGPFPGLRFVERK